MKKKDLLRRIKALERRITDLEQKPLRYGKGYGFDSLGVRPANIHNWLDPHGTPNAKGGGAG